MESEALRNKSEHRFCDVKTFIIRIPTSYEIGKLGLVEFDNYELTECQRSLPRVCWDSSKGLFSYCVSWHFPDFPCCFFRHIIIHIEFDHSLILFWLIIYTV